MMYTEHNMQILHLFIVFTRKYFWYNASIWLEIIGQKQQRNQSRDCKGSNSCAYGNNQNEPVFSSTYLFNSRADHDSDDASDRIGKDICNICSADLQNKLQGFICYADQSCCSNLPW